MLFTDRVRRALCYVNLHELDQICDGVESSLVGYGTCEKTFVKSWTKENDASFCY